MTHVSSSQLPVLLVVEDNHEQRLLLREFLSEVVPCDFREAPDGASALIQVQAGRPDLVLLDLHVPPGGGLEVLRTIRADAQLRDVPVIVLSGSRVPSDVAGVEAAGIFRFIEKPYDLNVLESAVLEALSPAQVE